MCTGLFTKLIGSLVFCLFLYMLAMSAGGAVMGALTAGCSFFTEGATSALKHVGWDTRSDQQKYIDTLIKENEIVGLTQQKNELIRLGEEKARAESDKQREARFADLLLTVEVQEKRLTGLTNAYRQADSECRVLSDKTLDAIKTKAACEKKQRDDYETAVSDVTSWSKRTGWSKNDGPLSRGPLALVPTTEDEAAQCAIQYDTLTRLEKRREEICAFADDAFDATTVFKKEIERDETVVAHIRGNLGKITALVKLQNQVHIDGNIGLTDGSRTMMANAIKGFDNGITTLGKFYIEDGTLGIEGTDSQLRIEGTNSPKIVELKDSP
jgi:hypothetical protein